jgi:hypothetical protein
MAAVLWSLLTLSGMTLSWLVPSGHAQPPTQAPGLTVHWDSNGTRKVLKSWTLDELQALKKTESRELDPVTGDLKRFEGVTLSEVFDRATASLTAVDRAAMDTVVLLNEEDNFIKRADIPRSFINRFPMMLAYRMEGRPLAGRGPLYSVVPWTTQKGVFDERLPLQTYFIPSVTAVVLTNSRRQGCRQIFVG